MNTFQKVIKYLAVAFALFLSISIIGGIVQVLASVASFGSKNAVGEMKTYEISEKIESIQVDISAADFVIQTGETFLVESNHKYLTVDERNTKLVISEKEHSSFSNTHGNVKLVVTVPDGFIFQDADISTGAGRVTVDTLAANTLHLVLGAGETKIESLTANTKADIEGGAGALTVNGGALHNLDCDMGVGGLKLTSEITGNSSIEYGVGQAELMLLGSAEDYQIHLDKGIGEATLDGKPMYTDSVYGTGVNKLDMDGGVGEIEIRFAQDAKAPITDF